MKIAITSTGKDLASELDPRFGRAAHFIIVDPESMAFDVVDNKQNLALPQGAGIQAGKTIVENKVDLLITGNCGPKAFQVLEASGVKVIVGARGRVSDVIADFKAGKLQPAQGANVEGHWV